MEYEQGAHPHPYLEQAFLYISNLPATVADLDLARAFDTCKPIRPSLRRDTGEHYISGSIEFKTVENAEKALATLQSRPIPMVHPPTVLVLSGFPPSEVPDTIPQPTASPRLIRHLPPDHTDADLYDLFRPYGALAAVRVNAAIDRETAVVEFWDEDDAKNAEEALHCADVDGQNISVTVHHPRRQGGFAGADLNSAATPFIPTGAAPPYSPTYGAPYTPPSPFYSPPRQPNFHHGPGQQVQFAPSYGPGSNSHSGLIDPCNLFIKNLDPEIDSRGLFDHFRHYGQIVSARVMRNEEGQSRGFGFVSFQTPDQAAAAMRHMDKQLVGTKQIMVRLHEPKQLRQEKLAKKFGGRSSLGLAGSGATSPTASEGGESLQGWPSPGARSTELSSMYSVPLPADRGRRGSGSYYNAALSGQLSMSLQYEDLSVLSPVVRKDILLGELNRRLRSMNGIPDIEVELVADQILTLSLNEVVDGIHDPTKFEEQVFKAREQLSAPSPGDKSPSPASQNSGLLDPQSLSATASAPEHPSTPISMSASVSTPPRTASPTGSPPMVTGGSEKERILEAVSRYEPAMAAEITELLMSLSKKERAMCLFSADKMKAKIADAKVLLEADDEPVPSKARVEEPVTPQAKRVVASAITPQTPDLSFQGASATSSPGVPTTPASSNYTLASLARIPAQEILKLVQSGEPLPVSTADPLVIKSTDEFYNSILDKPEHAQKQQIGDKMFRIIKAFGIKGAPKLTIKILDREDLRSLCHLMNSYPSILKEKVLLLQQEGTGK